MKKTVLCRVVFVFSIFLLMLIWAIWIHPFVVINTDDWNYFSFSRQIFPNPSYWNPSRVMPEVTMPFFGSVAAFVIYPLTGDYINSLTIACALAFSSFVALYIGMFRKYIQQVFSLTFSASVFVSAFYLLFHFFVFRTKPSGNMTLLYAGTPTSLFYYSLPTFLNITILLYLETVEDVRKLWDQKNLLKTSLLLLGIYMAVFSNLYSSIVLAVYAGVRVLLNELRLFRSQRKPDLKLFLRNNIVHLFIVALWIVSAIMEYFGGRSHSALTSVSFTKEFSPALNGFITTLMSIRKRFALLGILLVAITLTLCALDRKKRLEAPRFNHRPLFDCFSFTIPCAVLTAVFIILLSARVRATYTLRSDVWIAILCFIFLLFSACIAFLLKSFPRLMIIMPLAVLAMACAINTKNLTFVDVTSGLIPASVAKQLSSSLVEQVKAADRNGEQSVILDVPQTSINWPYPGYSGEVISRTLYAHKIISRQIEVIFHHTTEMNERFRLDENFHYIS